MTNRKWIESLSDEGLAGLIVHREHIPAEVMHGSQSTYESVLDWLRREHVDEKHCGDCVYYKHGDNGWAYCNMHSIAVRKGFEPCEKFRLKENDDEIR